MSSTRLDEPDRFVSKADIRYHFNTMLLYQKAATGELVAIVRDEHLAPRAARQPAGTVTQMVIYYDDLQSGNLRPLRSSISTCSRMGKSAAVADRTRNGCDFPMARLLRQRSPREVSV